MSKELQQPQVEPLLDTNRHRSAVEKTLESHSKGLVPERITRTLRMLRQNAAATVLAGLFAVGNANCNNVEQQNTPPPPNPTPAVSQKPEGMPSTTIQSVLKTETPTPLLTPEQPTPTPTTETPQLPPALEQQPPIPTPEAETSTPETSISESIPITEIGLTDEIKHLRDEKRSIYSKFMDEIEAGVSKDKLYFVKVGEKGKYQDRALIFTEPYIEQDGEEVWIAMTRDGPKSFRLKDSFYPPDQIGLPRDYIRTFIKNSVKELRQRKTDFLPYERAKLIESWEKTGSEIDSIRIIEPSGMPHTFLFRDFVFRPDPPTNEVVKKVMVKSQKTAGLRTSTEQLASPEQLAREKLEIANDVYESLKPHISPESPQPPTSTTQPHQ